MSAGWTYRRQPDDVGRTAPQILEEGLERAQDVRARREFDRRRRSARALAAAAAGLPPSSVLGLLVRHDDLDVVLSCDGETWRAHHDDGDGIVAVEGASPGAALDAMVAVVRSPSGSGSRPTACPGGQGGRDEHDHDTAEIQ